MFTFPTPGPAGTSFQAHFYTWAQLSELCSTRLTGLKCLESSISHKDLETIFTALQADDYDRDTSGDGRISKFE